jgi:hypothetical protein
MCSPLGISLRLETVRRNSVAVNWRGLPLAIGAADVDIRRGSLVILLPSPALQEGAVPVMFALLDARSMTCG